MTQEPFHIDAKIIQEPLDKALMAMANKLEREWPPSVPCHPSSPIYLRGFVVACRNIYRSMLYFCADKPPDPDRRLEYSSAAAPLARVVLEAVFNVTFLLEDLRSRTEWFEKAGWLSMWEDLNRFKETYRSDPDWSEYLKLFDEHVRAGEALIPLKSAEVANPQKKIRRWPSRARMLRYSSPALANHLRYLGDWFYKTLSEDAHLSWPGLVRQSAALLGIGDSETISENLRKQKSNVVGTTIILLLTVLSELELVLRFGLNIRLMYLWRIMNEGFPSGKELYVRRFEGKLNQLGQFTAGC